MAYHEQDSYLVADKLYYAPVPEAHKKRERTRARELRESNWWKQKLGAGVCYHCGKKFLAAELTMDHLIPIGRGGHSDRNNVVVSCKPCNNAKQSKVAGEWSAETSPENSSG